MMRFSILDWITPICLPTGSEEFPNFGEVGMFELNFSCDNFFLNPIRNVISKFVLSWMGSYA